MFTAYYRNRCISIHAPRTGSDIRYYRTMPKYWQFQSTLPARGATSIGCLSNLVMGISIHAPRTGSDITNLYGEGEHRISIHAPRTGSDVDRSSSYPDVMLFQSTLPARGAT